MNFAPRLVNGKPHGQARPALPARNGPSRVFLMSIQRERLGSMLLGRSIFQRMQVLLRDPAAMDEVDETFLGPLPDWMPMPGEGDNMPRLVRGELWRDGSGRLFEKVGDRLRPLQQLAAGPDGQIFELEASPACIAHAASPAKPPAGREPKSSAAPGNQASAAPAVMVTAAPCRALFPEPGIGRIVRWGDVKEFLAGQVAHPERLRETHRLPCHMQVYEVQTAQPLAALAAAFVTGGGQPPSLQRLTPSLAALVGLGMLLQNRPACEPTSDLLQPRDLVCRVQLAQDPTAQQSPPAMAVTAPPAKESPVAGPGHALRRTIPERFFKPSEFQLSREEVLYDMNVAVLFRGVLASLWGRLKSWLTGRRGLRKWQTLLYGRTLDEQLWTIRPPKGNLAHPAIRVWAQKTLEVAGYDAAVMLLEWEVFWRRKGV